ncbi:hypothetical protein CXG81DRAFT_9881 [Caulochytrium protostelioides]|uniref:Vacuolar protein sorting-associated protein 54 n=1 Tax=Caulochytrium protostelioides TaxID=1555241 RepID=A0A4P9XDG5_9FUNG|nr:hypothetical protein CXG81DRAFT_9881 [Caulochytrium protostelioides]|eukprot:RKP03191.1 hypothetical protein CXG81DRAFT_9881 [Caulochytrium protostelioides]
MAAADGAMRPASQLAQDFEALLNEEHAWTIKDCGRNSINAILGDPSGGVSKGLDVLPPVPATPIRKVRRDEFEPYLKAMGPALEAYQLSLAQGVPTAPADGMPAADVARAAFPGGPRSPSSPASPATAPVAPPLPSLDTIPAVFSRPDFNLADPKVWEAVTGNQNLVTPVPAALSENTLCQKDIEGHIAKVEAHLMAEISARSAGFFEALANLGALQSDSQATSTHVRRMRHDLELAKRHEVTNHFKMLQLARRRHHLTVLLQAIRKVGEIGETWPTVQTLLQTGDYLAALNVLEETMALMGPSTHAGSPTATGYDSYLADPTALSLRHVKAVAAMTSQLQSLFRETQATLERDFSQLVQEDLIETLGEMTRDGPGMLSEMAGANAAAHVTVSFEAAVAATQPLRARLADATAATSAAAASARAAAPSGAESSPSTAPLDLAIAGTSTASLPRPAKAVPPEQRFARQLRAIAIVLWRFGRLGASIHAWQTKVVTELEFLSRQRYPVKGSGHTAAAPSGAAVSTVAAAAAASTQLAVRDPTLARALKTMSFTTYIAFLVDMFRLHLHVMQRSAVVADTLAEGLDEVSQPGAHHGGLLRLAETGEEDDATAPSGGGGGGGSPVSGGMRDGGATASKMFSAFKPSKPTGSGYGHGASLSMKDRAGSLGEGLAGTAGHDSAMASHPSMLLAETYQVLGSVGEASHVLCATWIGVRLDQNAQLNAKDFYRFFRACAQFVSVSEILARRPLVALRQQLMLQSRAYLNLMHEERTKQIQILVDNEQWVLADVPVEFQRMTDSFLGANATTTRADAGASTGAHAASPAAGTAGRSAADESETRHPASHAKDASAVSDSPSRPSGMPSSASMRMMHVGQNGYYVVGGILVLVKTIADYMMCANEISYLAGDLPLRLLDLLRIFNARVDNAVLGAGALQSAGLKNITSKHIALAAQSLAFISAIVPSLRQRLILNVPSRQAAALATEFDHVLEDLRRHRNDLYNKLQAIMEERLDVHLEGLRATAWETLPPLATPDPAADANAAAMVKRVWTEADVTPPMAALVTETNTLHRVLVRYLDRPTLQTLFANIFRSYNARLVQTLGGVLLFSPAAKAHLLANVQYFLQRCSQLAHVDGPGAELDAAVSAMPVRDRAQWLAQQQQQQQQQQQRDAAGIKKSPFATAFGNMLRSGSHATQASASGASPNANSSGRPRP